MAGLSPTPPRAATSWSSSTRAPASSGSPAWAEQLIAESTGKQGTGVLPVVVEGTDAPEVQLARRRRHRGPPRRRRRRTASLPDGRRPPRPSAAASAPSCCCGRSPPPSPAACSASTPSTSPTWRAPRRRPARCSTTRRPRRAPAHRRPGRDQHARRRLARRLRLAGGRGHRAARPARPRARLRRGHGLPRPLGARRPRGRRARSPGPARGAPGHLRLGAALPALHRPVPQGRPGRPASTCRSPTPRRTTSPVPGRDFGFGTLIAAQAAGDATVLGRPRPSGAAGAPQRPRRRPGRRASGADGRMSPRSGPTRCATRRTGGCRRSPAPAAW